jgi:hypothetical protein
VLVLVVHPAAEQPEWQSFPRSAPTVSILSCVSVHGTGEHLLEVRLADGVSDGTL